MFVVYILYRNLKLFFTVYFIQSIIKTQYVVFLKYSFMEMYAINSPSNKTGVIVS